MRDRRGSIFIFFSLLIGVLFLAWAIFLRPNDPEIAALMIRNIARLETVQYQAALSLAADRSQEKQTKPQLDAVFFNQGVVSLGQSQRPALTNDFEARLYFPENHFALRGDFDRVNDVTYLRLNEVPSFGLFNVADVVKKWFVVPALLDAGPVSRHIRPLTALVGSGTLFEAITRLPDDEVDHRSMYHLRARIPEAILMEFVRTALLDQGASAHEADDVAEFVKTRISIKTIDLWVAKRGFALYRIRFIGTVAMDDYAPAYFIAAIDLREHNRATSMTAPVVSAPSIETILSPMGAKWGLTGFETGKWVTQLPTLPPLGTKQGSTQSLEAFRADTDRDELTNLMEQVYGTDPLNPDTDGDGFADGVEVHGGYNPNGTGKLP